MAENSHHTKGTTIRILLPKNHKKTIKSLSLSGSSLHATPLQDEVQTSFTEWDQEIAPSAAALAWRPLKRLGNDNVLFIKGTF